MRRSLTGPSPDGPFPPVRNRAAAGPAQRAVGAGSGGGPAMAMTAQATAARTMPTSGGPGAGEPGDLPPVADAAGAGPGSEASGRRPQVARDDPPPVPCP